MRLKIGALALSASLAAMAASPASADPYKFTLTGPFAAVFFIDSNPAPDAVGVEGDSFVVQNVSGNYSEIPGNGAVNDVADIQFFTSAIDGGLFIQNADEGIDLLTTNGPQLFEGLVIRPTFLTGDFTLTDFNDPETTFNLNIAPVAVAAVPEPSTWAMMIGGFGLAGGALRVRRKKVRFQQAAA